MSEERKPFQDLPGDENPQFDEDGKKIYFELRAKYPNNTNEHLDNVLNGFCCALLHLIINDVKENLQYDFVDLISHILNKNIKAFNERKSKK